MSGNRQEFREQWGLREGWSGGIQEFQLQERTADGIRLDAEGRVVANQNDYQLKLNLQKPDLGFMRFGFEQYRRYYDDTGGFYVPYGIDPIGLGKDLQVDIGRAWFDVGLTLPHWPKAVLGYEYQFKEGAKSSLAWGDVTPDPASADARAIFPAYKDIDEKVHILKLDVTHEIGGFAVDDSLRVEFYDLNNDRIEFLPSSVQVAPALGMRFQEKYRHFQAVNALRVEKQVKDWLLLGGGYLYSKLDGDGGLSQQLFDPATATSLAFPGDTSHPITLERESHVYNLSSLWGPWEGLSLTAGLQNEWTHEEGFGEGLLRIADPTLPPIQHLYNSQRDKAILQEDLGLRYTQIPWTVLFAESRFRQEWIDFFERDENSLETLDFLRDTDATIRLADVRTGFSISPWTPVSLEASYRHSAETTEYEHSVDGPPGIVSPIPGFDPPNGYPAFFRQRHIDTDGVEARLILRPVSWLRTTLKYQRIATDFRTETDSGVLLGTGTPVPGGSILAGDYDASIYSLGVTLTPWRRLHLATTFSYSDTRTITGVDGRSGLAPYQGDIYSVLGTANLILTTNTDWTLTYSFSRADYRQDNEVDGLPLGIRYDRHGILAGLHHRFNPRMTAALQYGFFYYDEPTSNGARNYAAHGIFASWKVAFE